MAKKRTIKQIIASGEARESFSVLLKNGTTVEGFLVQERVDKTNDTEGYNVYDFRTGHSGNGIELMYATIEPNVMVDWADSIATKQTLDFGTDGYLEVDNSDILEDTEYVLEETVMGVGEYDKEEIISTISATAGEGCAFVAERSDDNQPGMALFGERIVATFETEDYLVNVHYYKRDEDIDFVDVRKKDDVLVMLSRNIGNPMDSGKVLSELMFKQSDFLAEKYGRTVADICDLVRAGNKKEAEKMFRTQILFED